MRILETISNLLMLISVLVVPVAMVTFLIVWLLGGR